jgi:uncharacterized coiled-coil protein SlyX
MHPRPESRIRSLERRSADIEASIVELSSDTAEELKSIRQEIKASYKEIGDFFVKLDNGLEALKTTNKEDLNKLEARIDHLETTIRSKMEARIDHLETTIRSEMEVRINHVETKMEAMEYRINANMLAMETHLLDAIRKLQKPEE